MMPFKRGWLEAIQEGIMLWKKYLANPGQRQLNGIQEGLRQREADMANFHQHSQSSDGLITRIMRTCLEEIEEGLQKWEGDMAKYHQEFLHGMGLDNMNGRMDVNDTHLMLYHRNQLHPMSK